MDIEIPEDQASMIMHTRGIPSIIGWPETSDRSVGPPLARALLGQSRERLGRYRYWRASDVVACKCPEKEKKRHALATYMIDIYPLAKYIIGFSIMLLMGNETSAIYDRRNVCISVYCSIVSTNLSNTAHFFRKIDCLKWRREKRILLRSRKYFYNKCIV